MSRRSRSGAEQEDPRREIRVRDLLRMSSGLDFAQPRAERARVVHARQQAHADLLRRPQRVRARRQPAAGDRAEHAVALSQQRSADARPHRARSVEARGENYLTFPQRALFDRIGARNFVLETDAWGNFIMTGFDYGAARDWARFGLLHLWDGVWQGERILPDDWVRIHLDARARRQEQGLRRLVLAQSRRRVEGRARGRVRRPATWGSTRW